MVCSLQRAVLERQQLGDNNGGSVTGNNKVWRKFKYSAVASSKIRVLINTVPDAWRLVVEIRAFCTSASGQKVQCLVPDHLLKKWSNTEAVATGS